MTARAQRITSTWRQPGTDRALIWLAGTLVLVILITNLLSAYLRLHEAGLGCTPWPDCYGHIVPSEGAAAPGLQTALLPHEQIKQAHRILAGGLVLMVLVVLHQRTRLGLQGGERTLPYALAAVMLALAVVGPASYLKTMPAIATANILGGLVLLALTWRLLLASRRPQQVPVADSIRKLALVSAGVVVIQSASGAWTSANFAGVACGDWFVCEAPPGRASAVSAFNYFRELELDGIGRVVVGAEAWLIQHVHRLAAWVTALVLLMLALGLWRQGLRRHGAALAMLVVLQLAVGLAGAAAGLPLLIVLAHNLLAAGLIVMLIEINYRVAAHD
ncbi:MAG: COX15/CtaA family protein [Gammaproteobacteria bacterium]|nr:COX15/CtaA family protein [Gammaproteobacteria bacterium]